MIVTIKDYTIVTRATLDITGFLFLIFAITACINYCNLTFYNIHSDDEEKPRKFINIYKALVYNNINISASVIFVCVGTCFIDPEFFFKNIYRTQYLYHPYKYHLLYNHCETWIDDIRKSFYPLLQNR